MIGKLKVISTSNKDVIKKKTFDEVMIHFRDHDRHSITILKSEKIYVAHLMGATIEANSILWSDADLWTEDGVGGNATNVELRFYPSVSKS